MADYFDIHTHFLNTENSCIHSLYNIRAGIIKDTCTFPYSYGVHPYDVMETKIDFDDVLHDNNLKAIGEIGLDFRFQDTSKKQVDYFREQLLIADQNSLPVILHVVKSLPQVLDILKNLKISIPFIVHGFRGTMQQAEKIINSGGFISISPKYPSCIKELFNSYHNRILLETDQSDIRITDHYHNISQLLEKELTSVREIIFENVIKTGITL